MRINVINNFLNNLVVDEIVSGINLLVSQNSEILLQEQFGTTEAKSKESIQSDTIFDIASLTKVMVTTLLTLQLLSAKKLSLEDKVSNFLPAFDSDDKRLITIEQLLTHTSGLRPGIKPSSTTGDIEELLLQIASDNLIDLPGKQIIYTDLGFIILGHVIEKIEGNKLDKIFKQKIVEPLKLSRTGFNLKQFESNEFAKTIAFDEVFYGDVKVHDPLARYLDGVSGNAGLFSTIEDLHKLALMIENNGKFNHTSILDKEWLIKSRNKFDCEPHDIARGLGWELFSPNASCSHMFSKNSYGHTGYTGTSIWFEPENKLHMIVLSNRVNARNGYQFPMKRKELHSLVRENLN